ncbi:MAG: 2-phospho-L-lactate transferase CofD family protein [Solirubrobacteraceae bacterium]
MSVVLLSGGSGGAKLGRGLYELLGDDLTIVANTGDDSEFYGAAVSPDPDLVTYWLADRIDDRGWGIAGDTFAAVEMLRELGADAWFHLGDRDLAVCLERRRLREQEGLSATAAHARLAAALGVTARVLPMSDQPVHTRIRSTGGWLSLQEYMVRERASVPIEDIELAGIAAAAPSAEALAALEAASAIIIGPSNPVISIGPIISLPGMREALAAAPAPVVGVSPIVAGEVVKGPTAACLAWAGLPTNASGVIAYYGELLDGIVSDEQVDAIASLRCETLMASAAQRRELAERVLEFAASLS